MTLKLFASSVAAFFPTVYIL